MNTSSLNHVFHNVHVQNLYQEIVKTNPNVQCDCDNKNVTITFGQKDGQLSNQALEQTIVTLFHLKEGSNLHQKMIIPLSSLNDKTTAQFHSVYSTNLGNLQKGTGNKKQILGLTASLSTTNSALGANPASDSNIAMNVTFQDALNTINTCVKNGFMTYDQYNATYGELCDALMKLAANPSNELFSEMQYLNGQLTQVVDILNQVSAQKNDAVQNLQTTINSLALTLLQMQVAASNFLDGSPKASSSNLMSVNHTFVGSTSASSTSVSSPSDDPVKDGLQLLSQMQTGVNKLTQGTTDPKWTSNLLYAIQALTQQLNRAAPSNQFNDLLSSVQNLQNQIKSLDTTVAIDDKTIASFVQLISIIQNDIDSCRQKLKPFIVQAMMNESYTTPLIQNLLLFKDSDIDLFQIFNQAYSLPDPSGISDPQKQQQAMQENAKQQPPTTFFTHFCTLLCGYNNLGLIPSNIFALLSYYLKIYTWIATGFGQWTTTNPIVVDGTNVLYRGILLNPDHPYDDNWLQTQFISALSTVFTQTNEYLYGALPWQRIFNGDVGDIPLLPVNIQEILNSPCPFNNGQLVKDTHTLTLISKTLNNKVFDLAAFCTFVNNDLGIHGSILYPTVIDMSKQNPKSSTPGWRSFTDSYWVLMTKNVVPNSTNKTIADQQTFVNQVNSNNNLNYAIATPLEVLYSVVFEYYHSGKQKFLFPDNPLMYTTTQYNTYSNHYGNLSIGGFSIYGQFSGPASLPSAVCGVALVRKFG